MRRPNSAELRQLRRDNLKYPQQLVPIPRDQWPDPSQSPYNTGSVPLGLFRSRAFMVTLWLEPNGFTRLSVNRTDWDERAKRFRDDISWDDLQRLKAEAGFGDVCAIEVFPPDAHVVNVSNMRHLFLTAGAPPCMWRRDQ